MKHLFLIDTPEMPSYPDEGGCENHRELPGSCGKPKY